LIKDNMTIFDESIIHSNDHNKSFRIRAWPCEQQLEPRAIIEIWTSENSIKPITIRPYRRAEGDKGHAHVQVVDGEGVLVALNIGACAYVT
jgi:hypothetical protein